MGRMVRPLAELIREEEGCAYLLTCDQDPARPRHCGVARQPGSPYCPRHHALCHLPRGSRAEHVRLREVKALAEMVGGRRGREDNGPPQRFLERLEQAVREFL
jgi:hypothetical protein